MKKHTTLHKLIDQLINRLKLREKIIGLFVFCVIIPLIAIDGIIIDRIVKEEKAENQFVSENMAESVVSYFSDIIKSCQGIATSVSQNYKIGEVLGRDYESTYDYYEQYYNMTGNDFFQTLVRYDNMTVKLYTTNSTLVAGGYVGRIDLIQNEQWYQEFVESGKDYMFVCGFDESSAYTKSKRRIYFIERIKFNNNKYENFIRIDVDYSTVSRAIENMGHSKPIYICDDENILFSNMGNNNLGMSYEKIYDFPKDAYIRKTDKLGGIQEIIVLNDSDGILAYIRKNFAIIMIVILISIILPAFVIYEINYSIVHRIERLNDVFGKRVNDTLVKVDNPEGSDELGNLMFNYNHMVEEVNNLIQIVYKDRLKEQEMDIARQNAELLALHSQINPHFMFNALESIRMHSVIKGEEETAEMVEKLAVMERQYVDWGSDMIKISQEMSSVEAYLTLQKYRFGDRLKYELSIDDECETLLIPKLTIVTFVENACVHGMESKTSECWIFVRIYMNNCDLVIEVEDTGNGMGEDKVAEIIKRAENLAIDDLKNMGHVGIYNALLRLKMTMGDNYKFDVDSEEGIGTMIQIVIPEVQRHSDDNHEEDEGVKGIIG